MTAANTGPHTMDAAATQIDVNGIAVSCYRSGNESEPPLVLLHGGAIDSARTTWEPVWAELTPTGRLFAPDLPGFGATPLGHVQPTVHGYRDWLLDTLDTLHIRDCLLAGLSLGGAIALETALAAPERILGLALLAPYGVSAGTPGGRLGWFSVHLPGVDQATYVLLRHSRLATRRSLATLLRRPGTLTDRLVDDVTALLNAPNAGHAWQQLQRSEVRWSGPATNLQDELGAIHCPAVLMSGEYDVVPPADVRAAAARIPNARYVVVPGAGHWLPRDAPDEVATELIALRTHSQDAATHGAETHSRTPAR